MSLFLYSMKKHTNKPYNIIKINVESDEGYLFLTLFYEFYPFKIKTPMNY